MKTKAVTKKKSSLVHRAKKKVRRMIRTNFLRLPNEIRAPLERRMFHIHLDGLPKDMIFKLAETKEELEQAFKLLHDSYVREGFMEPKPSGLRVTPYHSIPTTTTLVAKVGESVIATVSLIRQTSLGLPIQMAYDVTQVMSPGEQAVEISSLAIDPAHRGQETQLLFWLAKYVLEYCRKYFAIDYMFVAIGPEQVDLYENIILFKRLHYIEKYKFSNDAPVVVEYLDMRNYSNELLSVYWNQPPERNVYAFIMVHQLPKQFKFPDRPVYTVTDPVMTPELLDYFFNQRTTTFKELTDGQLGTLHEIYRELPDYRKLLPAPKVLVESPIRSRQVRHQVHCPATFSLRSSHQIAACEVIQVSDGGFLARGEGISEALRPGDRLTARVKFSATEVVEVEAVVVWNAGAGLAGFQLETQVPSWERLIAHLKNDLNKVEPQPCNP